MSKKPVVALRKPPPPVDPKAAEAAERFVSGTATAVAARPQPSPTGRRRAKSIVVRTDGRELARKTVYLPPELARRLAIYAAETETDVSGVIAEICGQFLDSRST